MPNSVSIINQKKRNIAQTLLRRGFQQSLSDGIYYKSKGLADSVTVCRLITVCHYDIVCHRTITRQ